MRTFRMCTWCEARPREAWGVGVKERREGGGGRPGGGGGKGGRGGGGGVVFLGRRKTL